MSGMSSSESPFAAPERLLTKQTGVTLGLAVVVIGAAVTAAWWFGKWTGADSAWKTSTARRLERIESALEDAGEYRWRSIDMLRWSHRLQEQNPDLKVPEPYVDNR